MHICYSNWTWTTYNPATGKEEPNVEWQLLSNILGYIFIVKYMHHEILFWSMHTYRDENQFFSLFQIYTMDINIGN